MVECVGSKVTVVTGPAQGATALGLPDDRAVA